MNSLSRNSLNPPFSHIYVEKAVAGRPETAGLLSALPQARVIEIDHYKDVFCRSRQCFGLQKQSPYLILAQQNGTLLYEGAPVCQDFGNPWFYYASMVMNCIYDCEYCYLQGMYPSAGLVVFLNTEALFAETNRLLSRHPVYLSISYDTDLLALEPLFSFVGKWAAFLSEKNGLKLELRTKSANLEAVRRIPVNKNLIFAWTLSPEPVIQKLEHRTPSLSARLACAKLAMERGFPVRLCFDPLLMCENWEQSFDQLLKQTFSTLPADRILDAGVGVFRISKEYIKQMRKNRPGSSVVWYPYVLENGFYRYPRSRSDFMIARAVQSLSAYMPPDRIYIWNGN